MRWDELAKSFKPDTETFDRLNDKKKRLDLLRPLPEASIKSILNALSLEWTYNSNAIEGNTLTLQETKLVLLDGITVKGKSLREHFEAVNHIDAIEYIYKLADKNYFLTEKDILQTHALVLDKIDKDFAGRLRNAGVRITGANFTPPNALKVSDLLFELIDWVNNSFNEIHPVVLATFFHHRFVWIHPFFDGNGRTVRLLFNLLLFKFGYPPAIILKADRKKYYDALNLANVGSYDKLFQLVAQSLERSLDIYLSNFNNYADDYMPISNIVSEPNVPYGQEYVSLLARQGKIDAYKEGRVWYTTKDALSDYLKKRKRNR
ncbi:MAG: Fic family protein [Bacteroidia bacterium]